MKKNIAYYLEDPERLSEISLYELNKWVEEMPYSQPLRLLIDMKKEKFVSESSEGATSYGMYFAQDYELLSKEETQTLLGESIESSGSEEQVFSVIAETGQVASDSGVLDASLEVGDVDGGSLEDVAPTIAHNLVDDVSEDVLEDDLLEINPNVVLVNEVSHEAADEVLEEEVENEVLEIRLEEVEEVSSFAVLDNILNAEKETIKGDEIADDGLESESESVSSESLKTDKYSGLVDYKTFVVGVPSDDTKIQKEGNKLKDDSKEEVLLNKNTDDAFVNDGSDLLEHLLKKKKSSTKLNKTKKSKLKKKVKSKKNDKNKSKDNSEIKSQTKSSKKKSSEVKKVTGKVISKGSSIKSRSKKGKHKKAKKNKVKYVVVNEATANDFKLKDYDGVSNYASWLLEQKSINGNLKLEKEQVKISSAKKKGKNKKKRKKNKVLKVAQDSVKKSEMILSEPLANIMAAQGHTKKARKMYKQLGLIFPEKSSYFASKIENLKKK